MCPSEKKVYKKSEPLKKPFKTEQKTLPSVWCCDALSQLSPDLQCVPSDCISVSVCSAPAIVCNHCFVSRVLTHTSLHATSSTVPARNTHTHTHTHIYSYTHIFKRTRTHIRINIYSHTHTYTHTHTHTHSYIFTHTHTHSSRRLLHQ